MKWQQVPSSRPSESCRPREPAKTEINIAGPHACPPPTPPGGQPAGLTDRAIYSKSAEKYECFDVNRPAAIGQVLCYNNPKRQVVPCT